MSYPNQETACPYCGTNFARPPMRDRRCKACGNIVMVKDRPGDDSKRLMTIEQAKAADKAWEEHYAEERPNSVGELQKNEWCKQYLETVLGHPDTFGVRVQRGPGCGVYGCSTVERIVPKQEAIERPTIPCGRIPACYGFVTTVFKDEMGIKTDPPPQNSTVATSLWWRLLTTAFGKPRK